MFRKITLITLLIVSIFASGVFAANDSSKPPKNLGTVEMLGFVTGDRVVAREIPDLNGDIVYNFRKGSKVIVLDKAGADWYKVRLYNDKEAFISVNYISFGVGDWYKNVASRNLEKKFIVDMNNLTQQFNETVQKSKYARKTQVSPTLMILKGNKHKKVLILELLYSGIGSDGKFIPYDGHNPLAKMMKELLEVMFLKMMLVKADEYVIDVKIPVFEGENDTGKMKEYFNMKLLSSKVDVEKVLKYDGSAWEYIISTIPADQIFYKYPK